MKKKHQGASGRAMMQHCVQLRLTIKLPTHTSWSYINLCKTKREKEVRAILK